MIDWNNLSIRTKLRLLIGVAAAALLAFAAVSFLTLSRVEVGSRVSEDTHLIGNIAGDFENPPMSPLNAFPAAVRAQSANSRDEIVQLAQKVHQAHQDYEQGYQNYSRQVASGPVRENIDRGRRDAETWYDLAEGEYFPALERGDRDAAIELWRSRMEPAFQRNSASIDDLAVLLNQWSDVNDKKSAQLVRSGTLWMAGVGGAGLVLVLLLGQLIAGNLVRRIGQTAEILSSLAAYDLSVDIESEFHDELGAMQRCLHDTIVSFRGLLSAIRSGAARVAVSAGQIHAGAVGLSEGVAESAGASHQSATTMTEMQASSQDVARSAQLSSLTANQARDAAVWGASTAADTLQAVRCSAAAAQTAQQKADVLTRSTAQIAQFINTVNEIAEQTNLLALNAAIEAARAGEAGRGFGIVAGEVRRLAERTTGATQQIQSMVESIQRGTAESVEAMTSGICDMESTVKKTEEMRQALETIEMRSSDTMQQIAQIAAASEEQTAAIAEASQNLNRLAVFVERTHLSATETSKACAELKGLSDDLRAHAERFRVPDAGGGGEARVERLPVEKGWQKASSKMGEGMSRLGALN